jgi:putative nucleotidyltransferase with HDIG domain
MKTLNKSLIPARILETLEVLHAHGFEAYLVGGCVRDLLLGREPKDWDITTPALPEDIVKIYPKTVYENTFGTVMIVHEEETDERLKTVEVTPYRTESTYSDNRRPDEVSFSTDIHLDLQRRDFTMNAFAYNPFKETFIDDYKGQDDLRNRMIRTVGDPIGRFSEDALRILRAIRLSVELGCTLSHETLEGVIHSRELLNNISWERKRDEFTKIIMSPDPVLGIGLLKQLGLLPFILPELEEGIGCEQKGEHIYDVFEHLLHALGHAAEKNWPLHIRLAALFHDIGKPRTRRWDGTKAGGKGKYTFYGHEVVGAKMTEKILERLRYPKDVSQLIVKLVRFHMFFSDTETITLSAVRRTIQNIGKDNIWDLMQIRECDRVGMKKKEAPFRLRKYHSMIEEALRDPISVSQLKIDGTYMIETLHMKPGRRMGWMLHALLEEVLEKPELNTVEYLSSRVLELESLSDSELLALGEEGKQKKEAVNEDEVTKLRVKHGVEKKRS